MQVLRIRRTENHSHRKSEREWAVVVRSTSRLWPVARSFVPVWYSEFGFASCCPRRTPQPVLYASVLLPQNFYYQLFESSWSLVTYEWDAKRYAYTKLRFTVHNTTITIFWYLNSWWLYNLWPLWESNFIKEPSTTRVDNDCRITLTTNNGYVRVISVINNQRALQRFWYVTSDPTIKGITLT